MEKLRLLGNNDISPTDMKLTPSGFVYDFNVIDSVVVTRLLGLKSLRRSVRMLNIREKIKAGKINFSLAILQLAMVAFNISLGNMTAFIISTVAVIASTIFGLIAPSKSYHAFIVKTPIDVSNSKIPDHIKSNAASIQSSLDIVSLHTHTMVFLERQKYKHLPPISTEGPFVITGETAAGKVFMLHHEKNVNTQNEAVNGLLKRAAA